MEPTLSPGDRVLVRKVRAPSKALVGTVVVAKDPRGGQTLVIKRVHAIGEESVTLLGDNPASSTDSRTLGDFPLRELVGKVVYRYFPVTRAGLVN